MAKGIRERHARSCRAGAGGRCSCTPSYEAQLWNPAERRPVRKTFHDQAEARTWGRDTRVTLRRGRSVVLFPPLSRLASRGWSRQGPA